MHQANLTYSSALISLDQRHCFTLKCERWKTSLHFNKMVWISFIYVWMSLALTYMELWEFWPIHDLENTGSEGHVDPVPLCHQGFVVAPLAAHLPQRLPQRGWGEADGACQDPHLKQHTQHPLTQLVSYTIWQGHEELVTCKMISNSHTVMTLVWLNTLGFKNLVCSPLTVGGASSVSFIASRKRSKLSQVSWVMSVVASAADCTVLNTRWQNTACRFTRSVTAWMHISTLGQT